jgi:hypothetical protein
MNETVRKGKYRMCNVRLRICTVGDETQRRVTDDEENLKQRRIIE